MHLSRNKPQKERWDPLQATLVFSYVWNSLQKMFFIFFARTEGLNSIGKENATVESLSAARLVGGSNALHRANRSGLRCAWTQRSESSAKKIGRERVQKRRRGTFLPFRGLPPKFRCPASTIPLYTFFPAANARRVDRGT